MGLNYPQLYEGYVPAYLVSAVPFVTSSQISLGEVHQIVFPQVTRFFNIQNVGSLVTDEIAVGFTQNGFEPAASNYFTLSQGVSFRDEFRTSQLFISCSSGTGVRYQLVAGLTNIPGGNMLLITGSNGYRGVG